MAFSEGIMADVNVFETIMSKKRGLDQVSPSVEHLELYAAFVPPRKYLRRQQRCIVPSSPTSEPSSPPTLPRVHMNKMFHRVVLDNDGNTNTENTPNLSFETERMSGTTREVSYKEDPKLVMRALIACMKRTERSRSRLFLNRKSFPKEILETSDRLLHRNTTRKKLIWALEEELGVPRHVPKEDREEDQSREDASQDDDDDDGSTSEVGGGGEDHDHDDQSCLTNSPGTPTRHSLHHLHHLHHHHHHPPSHHHSPNRHYSVASSYDDNSPVRPVLLELRSKSDENSPARSAFRSSDFSPPPGRVSFATPATPKHFSYASDRSPSHVSCASDYSPHPSHYDYRHHHYHHMQYHMDVRRNVPRSIVRPVKRGGLSHAEDHHPNIPHHEASQDSSCGTQSPSTVPSSPADANTPSTKQDEADDTPRKEEECEPSDCRSKSPIKTSPSVVVVDTTPSIIVEKVVSPKQESDDDSHSIAPPLPPPQELSQ